MPRTAQSADARRARNNDKIGKAVAKVESRERDAAAVQAGGGLADQGRYDHRAKEAMQARRSLSRTLVGTRGGKVAAGHGYSENVGGEQELAELRDGYLTKSQKYR